MRQLIVGNWKMNGARESAIKMACELADAASGLACDLVICPPFTLLYPLALALDGTALAVGAQDCHQAATGAFTGDVAAPMVAETGATHVILGHSERRQYHGETDATVRAKVEAAVRAGLIPIVCVGESEAKRREGRETEVVGAQLAQSLPDNFVFGDFAGVVAYEPIWAIGTGLTPTVADVTAMHDFMRSQLVARFGAAAAQRPLLYGGSVKGSNAAQLLAVANVNGALVGGASLVASEFLAIAQAAT
jgi:triosephosphate isomerase